MRYQNGLRSSLWEWQPRFVHAAREEKKPESVPESPVRIGGDDGPEPAPLIGVAAAWALVFALAAVALAFSAVP